VSETVIERAKRLVREAEAQQAGVDLRALGRVTIADIQDAEQELAHALGAQRSYTSDPDGWHGHETLDEQGRRGLTLSDMHVHELDRHANAVANAEQKLAATWRALLGQVGLLGQGGK
jgi:hypothetical protein